MQKIRGLIVAGVSLLAISSPALAQEAGSDSDQEAGNEIVVTGTLVRGVQPTGTQVIGVDRGAVEATGASTVTQLLQSVPQLGSFNAFQAPVGGGNTVTTNRPNLRNLAASNTNGSNSTLMLVDGHRVVGMGVTVTTPDLDTIAPGAIERVEIVPDGGSSIYGADAVGGVINFITRKTYNGVGVDGRYGFADNYKTWDANFIVGKSWEGGGAYITYNYSQHDPLFGRNRDWARQYETQISGVAIPTIGIECAAPNMQVVGSTNIYGLPLTPSAAARLNQPNQCDYSDFATIYPEERRHAVFASLTQDLSDSLTFELKGHFMDREQQAVTGYFRSGTKTIGTGSGQLNSPFRSQYIVGSATEAHRLTFAFGAPDANQQNVHLRTWAITPSFTARLGDNWRMRVMANYGESETTAHSPTVNSTILDNTIRAGLFNPYAPSTSDPAALAALGRWETYGSARQEQFQTRAIIDGDLFQLPGGAVKVAVGAEYLHETFRTQKGDTVMGFANQGFAGLSIGAAPIIPVVAALPIFRPSRSVKSVFGEVVAPVLADVPFFNELTLSASGRYDKYSDAGDTFNPKFGLTWKPFEQLRLRAQWGKSFAAPSLANSADADPSRATWSSGGTFNIFVSTAGRNALVALGYPAPTASNSNILTLSGGSNNLRPQTAETWSLGADLDPLPGLRFSATYWDVKFKNLIASPLGTAAGNPARYFQEFLSSYIILPTQADIDALLGDAKTVSGSPCSPTPQCLYIIERNTTQNLGRFNQSGLDFSASYNRETGFGSVDLALTGSYIIKREQSVSATAALVDQLPAGLSRLNLRGVLGANFGKLRGQVSWNHRAGFDFVPTAAALAPFYPEQSRVAAFNTVDLFFKYDFDGEGLMKDLALTLGVNNVFDQDPPVRYVGGSVPSQFGYANGSTLGRLVQFGFSKKF